MCKHVLYTTVVNLEMNIVYQHKIKNIKKNNIKNFQKEINLLSKYHFGFNNKKNHYKTSIESSP